MGVEKVAFPREFFFVPERTDLNRTDRIWIGLSSGASNRSELLDTSHLFYPQNFPNVVSCSGKSGMNFPERGTAGWGSGKSEKVSGCSKLPPETSRAHLVPLKFPGENFPFTIRNSLRLFLTVDMKMRLAVWIFISWNETFHLRRRGPFRKSRNSKLQRILPGPMTGPCDSNNFSRAMSGPCHANLFRIQISQYRYFWIDVYSNLFAISFHRYVRENLAKFSSHHNYKI